MKGGAALPMVLLSIGLVAALSVGGAFVTRRYATDGRLLLQSAGLEPAIEGALVSAVSHADTSVLKSMVIGASMPEDGAEAGPTGLITSVWVTRLTATEFLFVCEGSSTHKPLWHKRLSLATVMDSAGLEPLGGRPWSQLP